MPLDIAAAPLDAEVSRYVRQNGRFLAELLTEAIAYLDGPEAEARVEAVRTAGSELDGVLANLSAADAVHVARALACHAALADIAEETAGRRRHAETQGEGGAPQTLTGALAHLGGDAAERLADLHVTPVLTAHPTEMRRRSIVDREAEIERLMALRRHHHAPALDRRIREQLFREVALLWRTRLLRSERITVADEVSNALAIVERSMLPALSDLYEGWAEAAGGEAPPVLTLGSWLGGDRDGHPGVDAGTLRAALSAQAAVILRLYRAEVEALAADLTLSSTLAEASDELAGLAERSGDGSVQRKDEPYRRALAGVGERLRATEAKLAGGAASLAEPYAAPEAFSADLKVIERSLQAHGGERLVGSRLRRLLQLVPVCGFHLLTLDLRQNADVHERTVAELFAKAGLLPDYLERDEETRVGVLLRELAHCRLLRSPFVAYSDETRRELAVMDAAREALADYGAGAIGAYIASKSSSVSDLLEIAVLLKQAGLTEGGPQPTAKLRIVPLFETIEDLEQGPEIIRRWLSLPAVRAMLGRRPLQEVMLGYSDSNKDGGFTASRRGASVAAAAFAAEAERAGVRLQLFHGRGGSIGRGGGSAAEAILAQPPGAVRGRVRLTEQGEMIARKYGDEPAARRNLDSLVAATLLASDDQAARDRPDPAWSAALDAVAAESFRVFRALVYDDPAFEGFFWSATPISEIADLKIGSRPASRTPSRRIEDLRAIPWVFSWSQSRFMLPGWYGFASGVEASGVDVALLGEMARRWGFFRTMLHGLELALAQSDMGIAERYAALASDHAAGERIFAAVRREHDAAVALALSIRGGATLLDDRPNLRESVEQSRAYVDPLNRLQLELLGRLRRGDPDPDLRLGVQLTINGVAAGLRNTG